MTAQEAYEKALIDGPSDDTRKSACQNAEYAYRYAINVDKQSRDDTRKSACQNAWYAYLYARNVDKQPHDDTRKSACRDSGCAYFYAIDVDKQPRDDTRKSACQSAEYAYFYAIDVDNQPRDDTRKSACQDAEYANKYQTFERVYQQFQDNSLYHKVIMFDEEINGQFRYGTACRFFVLSIDRPALTLLLKPFDDDQENQNTNKNTFKHVCGRQNIIILDNL